MSNGARHGLGVLIGAVVTPIAAVCLMYGTNELAQTFRTYLLTGGGRWGAAAALIVAAALLGLVAGSRLSPLASLIPGGVYAFIGLLWLAAPRWTLEHFGGRDLLPRELYLGYTLLAPYGIFLMIGVLLLVASVSPSRWKAATAAVPPASRFGWPPPAPAGPPMHGAPPQAPVGSPQTPYAPPAPGQNPPPWQGAPQPGQPQPGQPQPGQPQPGQPPAQPTGRDASSGEPEPSDRDGTGDENPGDWTQMYGGGGR